MNDSNICDSVKNSKNVDQALKTAINNNMIGREIIRFQAALSGRTLDEMTQDIASDLVQHCDNDVGPVPPSQTPKSTSDLNQNIRN